MSKPCAVCKERLAYEWLGLCRPCSLKFAEIEMGRRLAAAGWIGVGVESPKPETAGAQ